MILEKLNNFVSFLFSMIQLSFVYIKYVWGEFQRRALRPSRVKADFIG